MTAPSEPKIAASAVIAETVTVAQAGSTSADATKVIG
jgi:hypothetical protein